MAGRAKGIRVPDRLDREIREEMRHREIDEWSTLVIELIDEALRMRRAPGVIFVDGATGRRPVIAGSGLEVWEIVSTWKQFAGDYERLRAAYEWLTELQLRAALSYYEMYPEEVDRRLEREDEWSEARVRERAPFTNPRG